MKNGTMINVNVGARIISDPEKVTVVFVRYMKSIDDDSVVVKKQSKRLYFWNKWKNYENNIKNTWHFKKAVMEKSKTCENHFQRDQISIKKKPLIKEL